MTLHKAALNPAANTLENSNAGNHDTNWYTAADWAVVNYSANLALDWKIWRLQAAGWRSRQ